MLGNSKEVSSNGRERDKDTRPRRLAKQAVNNATCSKQRQHAVIGHDVVHI